LPLHLKLTVHIFKLVCSPCTMFSKSNDGSYEDIENQQLLAKTSFSSTFFPSGNQNKPYSNIRFRTLQPKDRDEIKTLHEEWFPVTYKDEFYDELVLQRMFSSGDDLYTCAAVCAKNKGSVNCRGEENGTQNGATGNNKKNGWKSNDQDDRIVACIVGSYVEVARMDLKTVDCLVDDPSLHTRLFYIMTLGTISEFRHCKLATKLVRQVIDEVKADRQCGAIYLHVITFNVAAIRFYEKLGFCRVTEIKDYYTINDQGYNCYLYAKYFNGNNGQRDYYYMITNFMSTVWRQFMNPFFRRRPITLAHNLIEK